MRLGCRCELIAGLTFLAACRAAGCAAASTRSALPLPRCHPSRCPLCAPLHLQGVVCQINPVNPAAFDMPAKRRYPPTIFVHMAQRDPEKAATVTQALAILK